MRKALEQFLRERLTALDPLRDVSPGGRADTEIIQPVLQYFGSDFLRTDIRSFVLDTLRNAHPELGIRPDGVHDDMLAKPASTLMSGLVREISLLRRRQLPDPRIHTLESAGDLLGALFVPVNEGATSRGKFRFYYPAPIAEILRPENIVFANGIRFAPTGVQTISQAEMRLNFEDGRYFFDVEVEATIPGAAGNLKPGVEARAPSVFRAVGVTNKLRFAGGADADTTIELLSRARNYPTQLSFSVDRGIRAILANSFGGEILRVEVVGMGDPDMKRDILRGGIFGPAVLHGAAGQALLSFSPSLHSDRFGAMGALFTSIGSGLLTDDYWLIIHTITKPGTLYEGRIRRVIHDESLELDGLTVPLVFEPSLVWEVRRRRITVSDVPGGLTFPGVDGTIQVRDDSIALGGRTDIYVLGESEENSSQIEVASDEDVLATGSSVVEGGGESVAPEWAGGYGGWLRLDAPDKVLYSGLLEWTDPTGEYARLSGISKGASDLSVFRVSPGGTGELNFNRYNDVLEVLIGGVWHRFSLIGITAVGGPGSFIIWGVERPIPFVVPSVPARIVRPCPEGIVPGRTMLVVHTDPPTLLRVVDWSNGFYQGTSADTNNFRAEVRVHPLPTVIPTGEAWSLVDDVDVDLSDPKVLRVQGTDLVVTGGTSLCITTSAVNMEERGVRAGDILRILSGSLAGEFILAQDPSGPAKTILQITTQFRASGTYRYQIFAAQTPVSLPLIEVRSAVLLDSSSGATGLSIPLACPLGAVSSQFANAGVGLKWRRTDCAVGMMGSVALAGNFTPGVADYLELRLYSLSLGYIYKRLDSGGPVGGYDFSLGADILQFLADLNFGLPLDFFFGVRPDGSIADPPDILDGEEIYLAVNPYDSDESWPQPGGVLEAEGTARSLIGPLDIPEITSRSVLLSGLTSAMLLERSSISMWNDMVQIETGQNEGSASIIAMTLSGTDSLGVITAPWTRYLPERNVSVRVGSPSIGYGRTLFRDPTLYEVNEKTRYTMAGGEKFMPDPRLFATKYPPYSKTERPEGVYYDEIMVEGSLRPSFILPADWAKYGIQPFDVIEADVRLIWFDHDFSLGKWNPAAGTYDFNFVFDGGPTLVIPVTTPTIPPGGYDRAALKAALNAVLDPDGTEPIAEDLDMPLGQEYLAVHTQRRILFLTGSGPADMGMNPATCGTHGNLSKLAQMGVRFWIASTVPFPEAQTASRRVLLLGDVISPAAGAEVEEYNAVAFSVKRLGQQRFSAKKLAGKIHASGLYEAEVELMSMGVGNEWNIGSDTPLSISDYFALGYKVSPEVTVHSFSVQEAPILSATPYIQDVLVDDDLASQTGVYGAGLQLIYDRSPVVADVQGLANSASERENNELILARAMRPCEVFMTIRYAGGLEEDEVRKEIEKLIRSQSVALDVSEIITRIQQLGAVSVQLPVEIGAAYMGQDRTYQLVLAKDRIEVSRLAAFTIGRLILQRVG